MLSLALFGESTDIGVFIIVVNIDNVNNDKSTFSSGERGFRGMGLVFKIHGQNDKFYSLLRL